MKKIECWLCGKDATISRGVGYNHETDILYLKQKPNPNKRCYCQECFEKHKQDIEEKKSQMVRLKKEIMFENAMEILEHQEYSFYKNKDAIEAVHEKLLECPDKFDSSYEIIVAIIFVSHRIYCKMQYKVDRYQVDFLLPDYHIIVEVDGDRHKYNRYKDSERDDNIKYMLGKDWEIIRIPTELLKENADKLLFAIDKVLEARQNKHINWRTVNKEAVF